MIRRSECSVRLALVLVMITLSACSSRVLDSGKEFRSFDAVDFEWARFRRPAKAIGPENETGSFDCQKSEDFFSGLDLAAIRKCFTALEALKPDEDKITLDWKLDKSEQPELVLRNPEDAPACIRETLPKIPFPREMVFLTGELGMPSECFSSRIALESGDLLGWEVPSSRVRLRVSFPLSKKFPENRDIERLLRSWILSVFRTANGENTRFHGRFLPTRYCLRCLGIPDATDQGPSRLPPVEQLWPTTLDVAPRPSVR